MDAAKVLARQQRWGMFLDEWLTVNGMSLRQLALKSGISPSGLSGIRTGKHEMTLRTAVKLANALDMPLETLAEIELSDI
jgi:transcriptional regulator with XRE-family HTH domain